MSYFTLSAGNAIDESQRSAIDDVIRRKGGSTVWRSDRRAGRSYALIELPEGCDPHALGAVFPGTLYERSIIALALFPSVSEALPFLLEALGGAGRPAGVLACEPIDGGLVIEWDPAETPVPVTMAIADLELRRFQSARIAEVLSPLPSGLVAAIAASGLRTPEIVPGRILELKIDGA